jgi:N-carbamoyl-L-amino-acid hydrolase
MMLEIDSERLVHEIESLGNISESAPPVVTRIVFTEADLRGREFVKRLCREAGLVIREDAAGNTFARWIGQMPELAPVATGSHIDAIPNAGRYDGTVGVLGALEAIRALMRSGHRPRRSIELIVFTSEEPTRFGIGCLGSRLMAGSLDASAGARLQDRDGETLDEVRAAVGFTGSLDDVLLPAGKYSAFIELHIEQGPILEQRQIGIGIVTAIAAPATLRILIEGEGGHAGAVLMPDRRDAFLAAAEIALAVEAGARGSGSIDTVATVGVCNVFPGAVNSIPSQVRIEVDVRDIEPDRRDGVLKGILAATEEIASRRGITAKTELVNADPPAQCSSIITDALEHACADQTVHFERMISRAYHDCLFMSRIAPSGMLFIPCRGGVSHRPDEFASPDDMARGVLVLAEALARLAD